jgi:hypothetical protein
MESVEEMMKGMNLSVAESKGIKVLGASSSRETRNLVQQWGRFLPRGW